MNPPARRARCPLCGRHLAVAPPPGESADVFPRHPPAGKRGCRQSRQPVTAADYVEQAVPR